MTIEISRYGRNGRNENYDIDEEYPCDECYNSFLLGQMWLCTHCIHNDSIQNFKRNFYDGTILCDNCFMTPSIWNCTQHKSKAYMTLGAHWNSIQDCLCDIVPLAKKKQIIFLRKKQFLFLNYFLSSQGLIREILQFYLSVKV